MNFNDTVIKYSAVLTIFFIATFTEARENDSKVRLSQVTTNANDEAENESAEDVEIIPEQERSKIVSNQPGDAAEDNNSSKSIRDHRELKVSLEGRAGYLAGSVYGSGIGTYYHLNPDLLLGLNYVDGEKDLDYSYSDPLVTINKADLQVSLASISAKYFVGNSFYIGSGIGQRKVVSNIKVSNRLDPSLYIEGSIQASSIVLNLNIGNTWTWNNGFFLGCEWIAMAIPLSSSSRGSINYSLPEAESRESFRSLKNDAEDIADKIGKMPTPSTLMLHIGVSF